MDLKLIERLLELMDRSTAEELTVQENGVTIRIARHGAARAAVAPMPAAPMPVVPAPAAVAGAGTDASPHPEQTRPAAPAAGKAAERIIRAGMTGAFYRSPTPGAPPFVEAGAAVRDGQTLALLEAMKTFNPVECDGDGTISAVHAEDGAMVEAGDPLFSLRPA
ncbi:acetyl-CoA carboxylase biotin carboxyl carrier protein [Gellertiella hungarica]|uniref:Biotin carboxyl carrier protein of acetyl-CoA carboxylase n=1 Tax=Gellertiella hungarica TaxID=1572859 RepID=A0A7W6J327_9HYPH|nr:acetyl-CoA carboxylase biotin carboxyl carrier protein [Gellertiella hungarica]